MKHQENDDAATGCPTGKRAHSTRRGAKRHALLLRQLYGDHLRPYECPTCGLWHVGHLPDDVVRGLRSADQHYQRRGPA
jgi:hypothetical protein